MDLIRLRKCKMFASKKKWTAAGKLKIQGLQMMPTNQLEQREEQIYSVIFWHWHSTLIFGWWWTEPLGCIITLQLFCLNWMQFNSMEARQLKCQLTWQTIQSMHCWFDLKEKLSVEFKYYICSICFFGDLVAYSDETHTLEFLKNKNYIEVV